MPGALQSASTKEGPNTERQTADLETLVQSSILSRRSEIGDSVCIGAPLGNGRLRWVVGSIIVDVGNAADETVGVAQVRHAHLLAWHELQGSMSAKVQHCISLQCK